MQKRFFLAPAAVVAFILFFTVFGDRGLLMISRLHRDRDDMQQKLAQLKGENDKLKREIAALQSDRRYLESIARRDFGLVRSNETIYQFHGQTPQPQQAAQPQQGQQGQQAGQPQPQPQQVAQPQPQKVQPHPQKKGEQKVQAAPKPVTKGEEKPAQKNGKKPEPTREAKGPHH